jgi:thiopurine S-methyltransferase
MDREFWLERWRTGATGWHQSDTHPFLVRHGPWLLGAAVPGKLSTRAHPPGEYPAGASPASLSLPHPRPPHPRPPRVFVPLCGASVDMRWLRAQGASVVGIDLAASAFQRFYDDAGLEPRVDRTCLFERWTADEIELLAGDFFDADETVLGRFDAVYDRAALFALPPDLRQRYARKMADLCRPGTRVLQVTFEYDQREMNGPPFAVGPDELHGLYGGAFDLHCVERADVLGANDGMRNRGVTALHECAWAMTRRA